MVASPAGARLHGYDDDAHMWSREKLGRVIARGKITEDIPSNGYTVGGYQSFFPQA